nr:oligosaccharide flippase family protein [uncultured Acetatifactor sp.]
MRHQKRISLSEKASVAYVMANLLSKGVNFITIPIFTRLLSTSEMGITTTFGSWQTIIYAVFSLGLVSGSFNIAMVTYENRRDKYMSVSLMLSSVSSIIFLVLMIIFQNRWVTITSLPKSTLWVMVLYLFLQPAMDFWFARNRYENRYKSIFWVSVMSTVLSSFVSALAVFFSRRNNADFNLGIIKLAWQYGVLFVFAIIMYIIILAKGKCVWDREMVCFALTLSFPLMVHSLAKNILDISDRLMIANICGQSDAGIYGTVYTISLMALVIWNAINSALVPDMFENLKKNSFEDVEQKIYKLIKVFSMVSIIAVLLAPEIIHLLTSEEYYSAVFIMPPLFASVFLSSIYNIYGNFLLYKEKTVNIMFATLCAASFNIIANYIFIKSFGYTTAAYTTLISTIILAVCQGIMQKKVYDLQVINHHKIIVMGIVGTLGCIFAPALYRFNYIRFFLVVILGYKCINEIRKVLFNSFG